MRVLVVIPILNPPALFFDTVVAKLSSGSIKPKILLINSGDEILNGGEYEVINILKQDFNHANTRNLALQHEADFYLFMTQDAMPVDAHLVENLLKPFDDAEVVVSYARQIPYINADAVETYARNTNYPEHSFVKSFDDLSTLGIKTFFNSNSCAMYRASYFNVVGGFQEGLIMNEDMEFAARAIVAGKKMAYAADAQVYHSHRYACSELFRRYFDIGVFMKTNLWVLESAQQFTRAESTGFKQALGEIRHLWHMQKSAIPKSICFSMVKFIAYKVGFQFDKLPLSVRKKLSLHQNWHKQRT